MEACRTQNNHLFAVVLFVMLGFLLLAVTQHAFDRHGINAVVGEFITNQTGKPYRCKDKDYSIAPTGMDEWMVKVLNKRGETITVFDCDDSDYLKKCLRVDGCDSQELPTW